MKKLFVLIIMMLILNFFSYHSSFAQTIENQTDIYKQFDSHLNAEIIKGWMKRLSAHPHNVGSHYDKDNAEYLASLFKSWGYDTHIEEFYVLFPTPKFRVLEMLQPLKFLHYLKNPHLRRFNFEPG